MVSKVKFLLAGILIIALATRLLSIRALIRSNLLFVGTDAYYHHRNVALMLKGHYLPNDFYAGFPDGLTTFWQPGFVLPIVGIAHIGNIDKYIAVVEASYPLIWGIATILILYLLGKELFNPWVGLGAGAICSVLGGHIAYSCFGEFDHHVATGFFMVLLLFYIWKGIGVQSRKSTLIPVIIYSLSFYITPTSLILLVPIMLFVFIINFTRVDSKYIYSYFSSFFLYSGLLTLMISLAIIPFTRIYFNYSYLSLLQPTVLIVCSLSTYLLGIINKRFVGILISLLPFIALFFIPSFREGITFFYKKDPWFLTVYEFAPLLFPLGFFSLSYAENTLSYAFYLLPISVALLIYREKKSPASIFTLSFIIPTALLAFLENRFVPLLCISMSIVIAWLFYQFAISLKSRWLSVVAFVTLIPPMLYPSVRTVIEPSSYPVIHEPVKEALIWLRTETPETKGFLNPNEKPEWGVMAPWWYGNWIITVGKRPAIACNFHINKEGNYAFAHLLLTSKEEEASAILRYYSARYLVLPPPQNFLPAIEGLARMLNFDPAFYIGEKHFINTLEGRLHTHTDIQPGFLNTFCYRAYFGNIEWLNKVYSKGGINIYEVQIAQTCPEP